MVQRSSHVYAKWNNFRSKGYIYRPMEHYKIQSVNHNTFICHFNVASESEAPNTKYNIIRRWESQYNCNNCRLLSYLLLRYL